MLRVKHTWSCSVGVSSVPCHGTSLCRPGTEFFAVGDKCGGIFSLVERDSCGTALGYRWDAAPNGPLLREGSPRGGSQRSGALVAFPGCKPMLALPGRSAPRASRRLRSAPGGRSRVGCWGLSPAVAAERSEVPAAGAGGR